MANFGFNINVEQQQQDSFEKLPNGEYNLMIVDSELKNTKAGTGKYLNFTFEVVDGNFKGKKVWGLFNIVNPNKKAEEIGMKQLNDLAFHAGHKGVFNDSSLIHNKFVRAKVTYDSNYDSNNIKEYMAFKREESQPSNQVSTSQPTDKPNWG